MSLHPKPFTRKEIQELKFQRDHLTDPRIKQMLCIVYYYAKGMAVPQIAHVEEVSESIVEALVKTYREGGLPALEVSSLLPEDGGRR